MGTWRRIAMTIDMVEIMTSQHPRDKSSCKKSYARPRRDEHEKSLISNRPNQYSRSSLTADNSCGNYAVY